MFNKVVEEIMQCNDAVYCFITGTILFVVGLTAAPALILLLAR